MQFGVRPSSSARASSDARRHWSWRAHGWSVTVVDKGGTPGCGSTSASSAMVRFNYDHLDEAALAWEAAARWNDWGRHLGVVDPAGMAHFVRTGLLVLDGELSDRDRMLGFMRTLGIGYEELDAAAIRERFPALDPARLGPACRVEDEHFWDEPTGQLDGFFQPDSGYVDDAMLAAHNLAHAAEHHGATFRWRSAVTSVVREDGRVSGVGLADGTVVAADVVVNAAGPWSRRLNEMAGVLADFTSSTRAVEQEVISVPAPAGFTLEDGGTGVHDPDFATYFRPHAGGTVIVGSFEPPCDPLVFVPDADAVVPVAAPGDVGAAEPAPGPSPAGAAGAQRAFRCGQRVRRHRRLGAHLRPDQPRRVLRRHRDQRPPVQGRTVRRGAHGNARGRGRGRARPRRRPARRQRSLDRSGRPPRPVLASP